MTEDHKTVVKAAVSRYIMSDWSEIERKDMAVAITDVILQETTLFATDEITKACEDAAEFVCSSIHDFVETELSKLIVILHPFWKLEAVKSLPETAVLRAEDYAIQIRNNYQCMFTQVVWKKKMF